MRMAYLSPEEAKRIGFIEAVAGAFIGVAVPMLGLLVGVLEIESFNRGMIVGGVGLVVGGYLLARGSQWYVRSEEILNSEQDQ